MRRSRKRRRPTATTSASHERSTNTVHRASASASSWWLSLILVTLIDDGSMNCNAQVTPTFECTKFMAFSDANRDLFLDPTEYVTFVNYMSNDYYGNIPFEQLPLELTTNFEVWAGSDMLMEIEGSYPGATPTPRQAEWLDNICFDTKTVIRAITTPTPTTFGTQTPTIAPTPTPTSLRPVDITFETCRTNMAVSDLSQDNLLDNSEYVRFINFMSESQFQYQEFMALPELLRFNFVILAQVVDRITGDRSIDVTGSAPGTTIVDVTPENVANLQKVCRQTQNAINSLNLFGLPTTMAPTAPILVPTVPITLPPSTRPPVLDIPTRTSRPLPPALISLAPILAPSSVPTARPTNSYAECRLSIIFSDANRDNLIGAEEYVELVYRLSDDEAYQLDSFNDLPTNIKDNYYILAEREPTIGEIDIYGVYPTQDASPEEQAFLLQICRDTELAIALAPTPAPVVAATMSPTRDLSKCRKNMVQSDTSPRDNFLNRMEYSRFVTRLSNGAYLFATFTTLPQPLQDNFNQLASVVRDNPEANGYGNAIYIYGAMGYQKPDEEQIDYLIRICEDTELALEEAMQPTIPTTPRPIFSPLTAAPTITPLTPAPTLPPVETPNPTATALQPVTTPQPTPFLSTPTPTAPVPPLFFVPTATPTTDDGGGSDAGAIAGGTVGGIVALVALCLCAYFVYTSLQGGGGDEVKQDALDGKTMDDGSEMRADDEFTGFGGPSTPTRPDGQGNIGIAQSPLPPSGDLLGAGSSSSESSEEDEKDEEMGFDMDVSSPSKQYGEFGGPDLPIEFGMDEIEDATTSGSEEERASDNRSDSEEEESEEEDEEQGFGGDGGGDFDNGWGQDDGGFGGGGWGASTQDDDEESASQYSEDMEDEDEDRSYSGSGSRSGSRSGSGSGSGTYDEEASGSYGEGESQSQMDEEPSEFDSGGSGGSSAEEDATRYSDEEEDNAQDDASGSSSVDEDENQQESDDVGTSGAFGDAFGGDGFGAFGGDAFGGGESNDFFGGGGGGAGGDDGFGGGGFGFGAATQPQEAEGSSEESGTGEDIKKVSDRLDAQIDSGDWDGVAQSIASFEPDIDAETSDESDDESDSTTEDEEMRESYRAQVEELVNRVIPDEKGNIDDMMEQFRGREQDLLNTLKTMEENSGLSKDEAAAPTPALVPAPAAAPAPFPIETPDSPPDRGTLPSVDEDEESFSPSRLHEEEDESQYSSAEEDEGRSEYSGEQGEEEGESSHFSREIEESMTVYSEGDEEGQSQFSGDEGQSQYSGDEGQSQYSGDEGQSQYSGEDQSQYSNEGESQFSGEDQSQYSGDEGQSQYSGEEDQSQYSGDEGQSQYSNEGESQFTGSPRSGEDEGQSQYSGDEGQSQYSREEGDEGTFYSDEGSRSYYSGDEEDRSKYSDEGQSQYSGEDQSQYDDEQGSYYSGEDGSRSYYSGEGDDYGDQEGGSYYSGSYSGSGSYEE